MKPPPTHRIERAWPIRPPPDPQIARADIERVVAIFYEALRRDHGRTQAPSTHVTDQSAHETKVVAICIGNPNRLDDTGILWCDAPEAVRTDHRPCDKTEARS